MLYAVVRQKQLLFLVKIWWPCYCRPTKNNEIDWAWSRGLI